MQTHAHTHTDTPTGTAHFFSHQRRNQRSPPSPSSQNGAKLAVAWNHRVLKIPPWAYNSTPVKVLYLCLPVCSICLREHVQYLLPEYLARGAVCRLNKGSQSPALKRTFIKHFHGLHLFPLATADKLRRQQCHITLSKVFLWRLHVCGSCCGFFFFLFLFFLH